MNYAAISNFATVTQTRLDQYLTSAIDCEDYDAIDKILSNLYCPNPDNLYKITDEMCIEKIIQKWRAYDCSFPANFDSNILQVLRSGEAEIVIACLDYLVSDETYMPLTHIGAECMADFGMRGSKHDEIMKIYLEYYPKLKKKYRYANVLTYRDHKYQSDYIISRMTNSPEDSVHILKLMVNIIGHRDQTYLEDLFKQSCANNNVATVKCALEINPNFHARIEDGLVINYWIGNNEPKYMKDRIKILDEEIEQTKLIMSAHVAEMLKRGCEDKRCIDELREQNRMLKEMVDEKFKTIEHTINASNAENGKLNCDVMRYVNMVRNKNAGVVDNKILYGLMFVSAMIAYVAF